MSSSSSYAVMSSAVLATAHPITVLKALSGIFGSISLTAWICLLLPQLYTNYKSKSADGLSMAFLIVWFIGDATNLVGALLTHLAPTAVALAFYFCMADIVLIVQCVYYNRQNAKTARDARLESESTLQDPDEEAPLLARRRRSSSVGLPGSHVRHATHTESSMEPIRKIVTGEDETRDSKPWLHNTLSVAAVYAIGVAGWFVSYQAGAWDSKNDAGAPPNVPEDVHSSAAEVVGMVLGYISAVCYLCARLPQIHKNWKEKSCEGLALLFFVLSMTGNLTYGVSLILYSQKKKDLINAIPWLVGSLGTILEDIIIFAQFRIYANNDRNAVSNS